MFLLPSWTNPRPSAAPLLRAPHPSANMAARSPNACITSHMYATVGGRGMGLSAALRRRKIYQLFPSVDVQSYCLGSLRVHLLYLYYLMSLTDVVDPTRLRRYILRKFC